MSEGQKRLVENLGNEMTLPDQHKIVEEYFSRTGLKITRHYVWAIFIARTKKRSGKTVTHDLATLLDCAVDVITARKREDARLLQKMEI